MSAPRNRHRGAGKANRNDRHPPTGAENVLKDDNWRAERRSHSEPAEMVNAEIILEDENDAQADFEIELAEAVGQLPKLPEVGRVEKRLTLGNPNDAKEYIKAFIRPKITLMMSVGHEALYYVIQFIAQLHFMIEHAPGPRKDLLRIQFGVKLKCAKPLNALINNLLGVPDAAIDGAEVHKAALSRHSKYAKAIRGAEIRNIPLSGLATALHRDRGLYALAEVARAHDRAPDAIQADDEEADDQAVGTVEEGGSDWDDEPAPVSRRVQSARHQTSISHAWDSDDGDLTRIEVAASAADAQRLAKRDGIAVCLVDRDEDVPELFKGLQVPRHLRRDRGGTFAWLKAAIEAAMEADQEHGSEGQEEAGDED